MLTEKSFDAGEIVINFAESDTAAPPLVMLHGSTLRWQTFGEFIPTLEQNWHIYACDLRGHGKSSRASSGYRIADFIPDTVAFIERFIGQPTVLLGYSTGAMVTLGVAAQLPKLVRGVVLLDPPLMMRDSSIKEATEPYSWFTWLSETLASAPTFEKILAKLKELAPEQPEIDAQNDANMILSINAASVTYLLNDRYYENFALEEVISQVACPTLLVRGVPELGGVVRNKDVTLLETHIPQITAIQISDIGHAICWGQPGNIALGHVTQFLNRL